MRKSPDRGTRRPSPIPSLLAENRALTAALGGKQAREAAEQAEARRFLAELVEAQTMCGAGPWQSGDVDAYVSRCRPLREALQLREGGPVGDISPAGAYGMYELLLQNVGWQREINYSSLEFSRWGIQQIILICRLYWVKNPIVRRIVNVCAEYVFARGLDVSSEDPAANDEIKAFTKRNQKTLGRVALMELERNKDRDGNVFWVFFADQATGEVDLRTIDAVEINDIASDPDDSDVPQYYQRIWTQRVFDPDTGTASTVAKKAWYPAINFDPPEKPEFIAGQPVMWGTPVYHRKVGQVSKWTFGCPRIYPMVDWAKESRRFLEACSSVRQSLSQFALTITTQGGQQAVEGIKQQMQTQVGPGAPIWDTNPPAINGATWVSGKGTDLEAFKVQGATFSPDDVRWYVIFCCMVKGIPPTFVGDMQTSNLATATSLDRPTETVFLSLQEEWIEDLTVIYAYALECALRAPGKLRESCPAPGAIKVSGAPRVMGANGRMMYEAKTKPAKSDDIEVRVAFPAIREGDLPALIGATVQAMTLGNRGGQIVGVDEKAGVLSLMRLLDIESAEELVELMYPVNAKSGADGYDPNRQNEELPPPIGKLEDKGGPHQQPGDVSATVATASQQQNQQTAKEAVKAAFARLAEAVGNRLDGTHTG